ncbi:MAG: BRCT domain-containing protein, partial [Mariniblastus sp.]
LLNSRYSGPLIYAAEYARTHARDLPILELIRLANHSKSKFYNNDDKGSAAVRKLAMDLLRAADPRKDVGLENWGLLLETKTGSEFAQKMLREHFGAKDLTPEWFSERLLSNSNSARKFAIDRLLEVHSASKLGEQYFYELIINTKPERNSDVTGFATRQLEKGNLDELDTKWIEQFLLHPNMSHQISAWVNNGHLSANRFDPEFLKSIAFHPMFEQTPQVVEAKSQTWGEKLSYDQAIARNIFHWLGDIRLFTPDQIGFQWLMELVARGETLYHEFAVETMNKAFLPADFATQEESKPSKNAAKKESKSDEISIDFEKATFVFTGKLATMTRGEAQKKVESANGKNSGTVNKSLGYLVIGDEGSPMYGQGRKGSKQVKAESLCESGAEIKIISETAFLQMLSGTKREFSEDSVQDGCENLWKMLTESEKENSPLARFALNYIRLHHAEICLEETDRPVDPGSEIPDSFLTFERVKPLLLSSRSSLRNFGLELSKWEFARWSPKLDELIELCESPIQAVSVFVTEALLAKDSPQNRRVLLNPETFTTDSVYEFCQSKNSSVRAIGMELINRHPRLREPDQLFKLTESPDRSVRAFVVRAFWSLYRSRSTTGGWNPTVSNAIETKKDSDKRSTALSNAEGIAPRPDNPPAEYDALQFLLRRMLFEVPPGRPPTTTGPKLDTLQLKPIPTRKGKMLLIETLRDLAIEDASFAEIILPILLEFMNSQGMSEHDSCLVAVARIEVAHPHLKSEQWRDPDPDPINVTSAEGVKS